jgi:hypothetical protein
MSIRSATMKFLPGAVVLFLLVPDASASQTRGTRPTPGAAAERVETYKSAVIDAEGSLRITTADRGTIVVPRVGEQSAFREPILSADRTAVGAQVDYPNCCTSYDIPLQLVVYAKGRLHRFGGIGLPIFQWHFADRGSRVAFGQETVHFSCAVHYELRDIQSERVIESAEVPQPCGQVPDPKPVKVPKWVSALAGARN